MRRVAAALILASFTWTGCYKWSPHEIAKLRADTLSRSSVQLADGTRHEWRDLTLRGDSLVATADGRRRSVPLDSVGSVEARRVNWLTTGLLIYVGLGTSVVVVQCATGACGWLSPD